MYESSSHDHTADWCPECGAIAKDRAEKIIAGIQQAIDTVSKDAVSPEDKSFLRGLKTALALAKIYEY